MTQPRARIKPGRASLIGGIAVAIAAFVVWVALARDLGLDGALALALGAVVAIGAGTWIRLADL